MSMAGNAFQRVLTISTAVGVVTLLSLGSAQAQTRHRRHVAGPLDREFNADASMSMQPRVAAPVVGAWRYNLLRHGCDRSYPMVGSCGTATGGPVGGLGS